MKALMLCSGFEPGAGSRMGGADESTELCRRPFAYSYLCNPWAILPHVNRNQRGVPTYLPTYLNHTSRYVGATHREQVVKYSYLYHVYKKDNRSCRYFLFEIHLPTLVVLRFSTNIPSWAEAVDHLLQWSLPKSEIFNSILTISKFYLLSTHFDLYCKDGIKEKRGRGWPI